MDSTGRVVAMSPEGWPYPPPIADGAADHLIAGLVLPDIELHGTQGPALSLARLSGRTAVFVYPWTGTPGLPNPPGWDDIPGAHGSTPALSSLINLHTAFLSIGVRVVGVSGQPTAEQAAFAARLNLPFELLSDADGRLAAALRLPTFKAGGTTYLSRLTLTMQDGRVMTCTYPVFPPHTHARSILAEMTASSSYAVEAAKFNPQSQPVRRAD